MERMQAAQRMSLIEQAERRGERVERAKWVAWLQRMHYGIDFNFDEDPPCEGMELALAAWEVDRAAGQVGDETPRDYLWTMQQETGAFLSEGFAGLKVVE